MDANLETGILAFKLIDRWKTDAIILGKISAKFKFHHFFHPERIAFWGGGEIGAKLREFLDGKKRKK